VVLSSWLSALLPFTFLKEEKGENPLDGTSAHQDLAAPLFLPFAFLYLPSSIFAFSYLPFWLIDGIDLKEYPGVKRRRST
jgi:hypothetical protein